MKIIRTFCALYGSSICAFSAIKIISTCIFTFKAYIIFWILNLSKFIQNKVKLLAVQAPQVLLLIYKLDGVQFATHLFGVEVATNDFSKSQL